MRKRRIQLPVLAASLLLAMASVTPTTAAAPGAERWTIMFPDFDRGLVVIINTTRAQYCTAGVVAYEEAIIDWIADFDDWIAGGEVGPEPPFPDEPASGFPEGNEPVRVQLRETNKGVLMQHFRASGLGAEIWPMVPDAPGVGPCTDTSAASGPVVVGSASVQGHDNDLEVSGTRGNAWGDRGTVTGSGHRYAWRFHVNDRCYAPEDGPPRCEIVTSSFQ